jgi:hypothetical protein
LQLVDKAFCLSAAKKKEYEAFRSFRQPSFLLPGLFRPPLLFRNQYLSAEEANFAKRARPFKAFAQSCAKNTERGIQR